MATDAEIVAWHRAEAAALAERSRGCRVRADNASSRPYQKVMRAEAETSDTFAAHHTRAADAIEDNARLRALLATLRTDLLDEANRRLGTAWGDSCGRRVAMVDGTIWDADAFAAGGADALRTPDAAG